MAVRAAFTETELLEHAATVCTELGLPSKADTGLYEQAKALLNAFQFA